MSADNDRLRWLVFIALLIAMWIGNCEYQRWKARILASEMAKALKHQEESK